MIPQKIQAIKYYLMAVIDLFLLQMHFWDWVDETVRRGSVVAGLLIAVLTAVKLWQDIRKNADERALKRLERQRKEEEFRRFMEEEYRDR